MEENEGAKNVYGANQTTGSLEGDGGIRNQTAGQGTGQDLDESRRAGGEAGGGMGRAETPREKNTQGEWHNDANQDRKEIIPQEVQELQGLDETPTASRNAPGSDEQPA